MTLRSAIGWLAGALVLGIIGITVSSIVVSNDAPAVPASPAATQQMPEENRDRGAIKLAPRAAAPSEHASIDDPVSEVPLTRLTDTRERPIFSPSRRPPPPPAVDPPVATVVAPVASVPVAPVRPPLSLVGTIVSDTQGIGLFIEPGTKNVLRLKTGEGYEGWTLRSVEGREVTLASDSAAAILTLPAPGTAQPAEPRSVEPRPAEPRSAEQTDPPPADADPPPPHKREPRPKRVHH